MTLLSDHLRMPLPHGRTLVIAEIGVNHDGSLSRALELVEHAAVAGADAIKLQLFRAQTLMHPSAAFAAYQKDRCADADPVAMLRRYELSTEDVHRVIQAIRERNLLPLATPFSLTDVDALVPLNLPAVKIASPDLVNYPLLKRAASLNRPLLISTGAATLEEIATSVGWLRDWKACFALLHCVSSYPTPIEQANLCWISEFSTRFAVPVGFSDHTSEPLTGALAVAGGAVIIEKHLTYDRSASGPDHAASADPEQFACYVRAIRLAEQLRGSPGRRLLPVEEDVRRVSRQSLVLARAIEAGRPLVEEDLTTQRPGTGIPASDLPRIVGRCLKCDSSAGTMLQWEMLAGEGDESALGAPGRPL